MKSAKIQTFLEQIRSGQLKTDKHRVFSHVRNNPGQIEQVIAKQLGMPLQTVSARCAGLKDLGVIVSLSQISKGKSTHESLYVEEDILKIAYNQRERKQEKWVRWLKKADDFSEFISENLRSEITTTRYEVSSY